MSNESVETYTAKDIIALLETRFKEPRQYTFATEVGNSTGMAQTRRLDFCVIDHFQSNDFAIEGIEVKISKADLMTEIRNPSKHNIFFDDLNFYSLACPHYILDKEVMELIPPHWGIYVVKDNKLRAKRKPVPLHDRPAEKINKEFVSTFIRRINEPKVQTLDNMLQEEYDKGYTKGYERGQKVERETHTLTRTQEYADNFRTLINTLNTTRWELEDAIPFLSLIIQSEPGGMHEDIKDLIERLTRFDELLCNNRERIENDQN